MLQRIPLTLASRQHAARRTTAPNKPSIKKFHTNRPIQKKAPVVRKDYDIRPSFFSPWGSSNPMSTFEDSFFSPDFFRPEQFGFRNFDQSLMSAKPAMDIVKSDKGYNVSVELPGMKKEDITLSISDDNMLTIKGETKKESEEKNDSGEVIKRERYSGKFMRSAQLPAQADLSKINAKYDAGVLEIEIPNKAETKDIKVDIQ